jgi:hypothetical protein
LKAGNVVLTLSTKRDFVLTLSTKRDFALFSNCLRVGVAVCRVPCRAVCVFPLLLA